VADAERLSRLSTHWSLLRQAHGADADAARFAREALLCRYARPVSRYLLGATRDAAAAEELSQEFALRFVRGDFRRADPGRGRFRDYLRTALAHLVDDHARDRRRWPAGLPAAVPAVEPPSDPDAEFRAAWREELLARTWAALAAANPVYHVVLHGRVEWPAATSAELAASLAGPLGRAVNAAWVRKTLQRAHDRYADLLIDEVAASLDGGRPGGVRQELEELDLLRYCRAALDRHGGG
jgi:DNA-directed RNA polymerase specialized sigma24 family protein